MLYLEGNPPEAKSFTDETSPHKRHSSDRKVSIHGQVIRELSLSWFYDLIKLYPGEPGEVKWQYYQEKVDLSPFKKKTSSVTGKVVKAAAKSGSVFNPAIELAHPLRMFRNEYWVKMQISSMLRESHAFDEGDERSLDWIDRERRDIGRMGVYYNYPLDAYEDDGLITEDWQSGCNVSFESYDDIAYGRLYRIKSEGSSYIQAADIAAGFARQVYERHGIPAVAGNFECVTLNGERITHNNAEQKFEIWRQLIDQERKDNQQKLVIVDY